VNLAFCSVNYQSQCMVNQTFGVLNRVNRQGDVGWTNSHDNKIIKVVWLTNHTVCQIGLTDKEMWQLDQFTRQQKRGFDSYPFSMDPILCSGKHVHYFTVDKRGEGFVGPPATRVITAFCCPTHRHNCRQHFCLPPVFSKEEELFCQSPNFQTFKEPKNRFQ
jgi:hypothetical protein